ncbi:MAG: ARPP-1 family domain-containing protein [Miltoncostaeaceae bacterium]
MSTATTLTHAFAAGEPVTHRGITVVPLFPASEPLAEYITLAEGIALGLSVTEVDEHGEVGELLVANPTAHRVLMYDGEELEGAKQNRILNVSVLVEASSTLAVPVSCVEAGRWGYDGDGDHQRVFSAISRTSSPRVRRAKEEHLRSAPLARGVAQSAVWSAVDDTLTERGSLSPTAAYSDAVRHVQPDLDDLVGQFPLRPGQCGVLLGYAGAVVCMDAVSRAEVYEGLHQALLAGYVMDALSFVDGKGIGKSEADDFLAAVSAAEATRRPSAGLGDDLRLSAQAATGSGLELHGEVIQMTAYPTDSDDARARSMQHAPRIARPTRRRTA